MLRTSIAAACISLLVGAGLIAAVPAQAATSVIRVHTTTRVTAYNHGRATVRPSVSAVGHRTITGKKIAAYRGSKRIARGNSVRLKAGTYRTMSYGTYRGWRYVKQNRTRRVLHDADYVSATCTVTRVLDDFGDGDTYTRATCRNSYYPTQRPTDEQVASYQVGDTYTESVFFDDEYVSKRYTVNVRKYGATHHFTTAKRKLVVKDGGYRRVFSGSGSTQTRFFHPPTRNWKLSYSFSCSDWDNFIITLYRSNGDYVDLTANELDYSGRNTTHYHSGGKFYLDVDTYSECDWRITIR